MKRTKCSFKWLLLDPNVVGILDQKTSSRHRECKIQKMCKACSDSLTSVKLLLHTNYYTATTLGGRNIVVPMQL